MKKRGNHDAGFKARVALEAMKGERTVSELVAEHGVRPTPINQWGHRFVADLDVALGEQILHVPQREREAHVEHHRQPDDLG